MTILTQDNPKRIAIFSDTHGNKKDMAHAISRTGPFDRIVHLGDGFEEGKNLADTKKIPFTGVYGNEDYGIEASEMCSFSINGWNICLLHGHQFAINQYETESSMNKTYNQIADMAKNRLADILLMGHTHLPMARNVNGIFILNPGDQYIGSSAPPTFAILNVNKNRVQSTILGRKGNEWIPIIENSVSK